MGAEKRVGERRGHCQNIHVLTCFLKVIAQDPAVCKFEPCIWSIGNFLLLTLHMMMSIVVVIQQPRGMNPGCGNTTNTIVRLGSDGQIFRVRVSQYIMSVSSICICGIDFGKHHGYKP